MEEGLYKKSFVVGIVALFVIMGVFPVVNAAVNYGQTQNGMAQVEFSVSITKPKKGHLYVFNYDLGETPSGNTLIVGSITIKASVVGGEGEVSVVFNITGVPRFTDTEEPYAWDWKDAAVGNHLIKVEAYDEAGHAASESLEVKVLMRIKAAEVENTMAAEALIAEAVACGDIDAELASSLIQNLYDLEAIHQQISNNLGSLNAR